MSLAPNEVLQQDWKPTASLDALKARAALLADIRDFFKKRQVLEVETPLLCKRAATDLHLSPIPALYSKDVKAEHSERYYLQTSPEFCMKRLLAAGGGSIYQICKAFRNGETGNFHNPEFSILEWYRLGFDHHQLMDEMDLFLQAVLQVPAAEKISYQDLFLKYVDFDPHTISSTKLMSIVMALGIKIDSPGLNRDDYLHILLSHVIEPQLGHDAPIMIFDYPETQAALAKIKQKTSTLKVAERFEVYIKGVELANGYHELTDARQQALRFQSDTEERRKLGYPEMSIDERLIAALEAGLPHCAGVALGIDRLLMLKLGSKKIEEVLSFSTSKA